MADLKRQLFLKTITAVQSSDGTSSERPHSSSKDSSSSTLLEPLQILEVGVGTLPNWPFYSELRSAGTPLRLTGIDPNPAMFPYARGISSGDVELIQGTAERMPVRSASVDVVVSTLVLCSVSSPKVALEEVQR